MSEDIKRKLSSRKLWLAVAAFVASLILAFGGDQETVTQVTGCIMAGAAVIAYILSEGWVDSAREGNSDVIIEKQVFEDSGKEKKK